jgi:hypothetical protein
MRLAWQALRISLDPLDRPSAPMIAILFRGDVRWRARYRNVLSMLGRIIDDLPSRLAISSVVTSNTPLLPAIVNGGASSLGSGPRVSVVVDLRTDVSQEALRSRALTGGLPAAKHLILGQKLRSRFASVRLFSAAAESPDLHAGLVWRVDLAQPDHPSSLGQPDAP